MLNIILSNKMKSSLRDEIKKRLEAKHMSVNALEKEAGINKGTVQNIMRGKSKHPRIDLLQAIATSLECSVTELLGQEMEHVETEPSYIVEAPEVRQKQWNANLYMECLQFACNACEARNIHPFKEEILPLIDEIYEYSLRSGTGSVDTNFGEYLLEKNLFNKR